MMAFGVLEILALILISITLIKLLTFLIDPKIWYRFLEGFYRDTTIASFIAFVLAIVVLYFLLQAGVTIVEILAVCLFIALLIVIGLAKYANDLIPWIKNQDIVAVLKEVWLYTLVWLLLIAWGVGEIFIS